jgi:hypothetical protein
LIARGLSRSARGRNSARMPSRYSALMRSGPAGQHVLADLEHRQQAVPGKEIDDPVDVKLVQQIRGHHERVGALAHHRRKRSLEFV